jgi:D-3-phosphoglycerate dehydrogenase
MKIAVIHDYADAFRKSAAYPRLREHEVLVDTGTRADLDRLAGAEAPVLTQQRVPVTRELLARLPRLRRTAELAWGLILASLRHLPYEVARLYAVAVEQLLAFAAGKPISRVAP